MKKTPIQLPISLPRILILGAGLLIASLPFSGWSAASKDDDQTRRQAVMAKLNHAKEVLDPNAKLDESATEAQRLVGTIKGETAVLPALRKFLEEMGMDSLAEYLVSIKSSGQGPE
jgi:hypothetical protein